MRVLAYVDGYNLYHGIKKCDDEKLKWINIKSLCESFCKDGKTLQAVNYYSAFATWLGADVYQRHNALIKALEATGVHCAISHFKKKPARCPSCKHKWNKHEEKETDVKMSIQMVADAYENKFDCAMIISNDTDFIPAIQKLKEMNKFIFLLTPPNMTKMSGMIKLSQFWEEITSARIQANLLPDSITLANGNIIHKPSKYY